MPAGGSYTFASFAVMDGLPDGDLKRKSAAFRIFRNALRVLYGREPLDQIFRDHGEAVTQYSPAQQYTCLLRRVRNPYPSWPRLSIRHRADTPKVAVVGEALARFYFGDRDPLGQTFTLGGEKEPTIIVGIITEDVRHERLTADAAPKMIYAALAQSASVATLEGVGAVPAGVTIALRTEGGPEGFSAAVRAEVQRLNPNAMVWYIRTMTEQLEARAAAETSRTTVDATMAVVAPILVRDIVDLA